MDPVLPTNRYGPSSPFRFLAEEKEKPRPTTLFNADDVVEEIQMPHDRNETIELKPKVVDVALGVVHCAFHPPKF